MLINLAIEPWYAINDGVMGGISSSQMIEISDGLRFQGTLSLENNGGFASVRRAVDENLDDTVGIHLKVRGDGRRYQLRLRQDRQFDGVSWQHEFDTLDSWQTLELRYADFKATYRGRPVPSAGPIQPQAISQIGFLLGDKNPGAFNLDIAELGFIPGTAH